MGPYNSRPKDSQEILSDRQNRANILVQRRQKRNRVLSSMVERVVQEQIEDEATFNIMRLPDSVVFRLTQLLAGELHTLLRVSANWNFKVMEAIDTAFAPIESSFAMLHSNLLLFTTGKLAIERLRLTGQTGVRCDRVLVAEPQTLIAGQTVKIRCTYRFYGSANLYRLEFKFDCVQRGRRTVWLHKDETRDAFDTAASSAQVPEICAGDHFEIALNWFNLQGLVDLDSIEWQMPLIQNTLAIKTSVRHLPEHPQLPRHSINNTDDVEEVQKRLLRYDVSRRCEVELAVSEWVEAKYFTLQTDVYYYDHFQPFLRLKKVEFAGVETVISRNTYVATEAGIIPDALVKLGLEVEIKQKEEALSNEVRRMGLLFDRHRGCELRVGDTLVLYISRGI